MKEQKATLGFRCPSDLQRKLEALAATENRSLSQIIVQVLYKGIEAENNKTKESKLALDVMDYLETEQYASFGELLIKAKQNGKYDWVQEHMGWFLAYHYICAKLNINPEDNISKLF